MVHNFIIIFTYVPDENRFVGACGPDGRGAYRAWLMEAAPPVLPVAKIISEVERGYTITIRSLIFIAPLPRSSCRPPEIRDVQIPQGQEDAMSREAQAQRERHARIILSTAETEISDKFAQAAEMYKDNPVALHLRAMNMLYEAIKEMGSMVIVPSSAVETMGLGGMMGMASMGRQMIPPDAPVPTQSK